MKDLKLVPLDSVEEKEVDWLWYPYIPKGKLTIIQGDPGSGKTMFMLKLAAILSTGEPLPFTDGSSATPLDVIYQTSEDGYDDTIKPRLKKANADCSKVHFISEDMYMLSMTDERIEAAIRKLNAQLFVLDPIQAYVGPLVDINKANEVRPVLKALADVATRTNCAICLVGHMNKSKNKSTYKGLGSIDFYAAARSVLLIGSLNDDPDTRIVIHDKSSLAPAGDAFSFELSKENGFRWKEIVHITSSELLEGFTKRTEKQRAKDFLVDLLSDGDYPSTEIFQRAEGLGISKRTLETAKQELKVKSIRDGTNWVWELKF